MFARSVRAAAFIVFSAASLVFAQSQPSSADKPIAERTIAGGDVHRYELVLAAGEYVRASVLQRGVDVVVHAIGPDGAVLGQFNEEMRDGMDEQIELVAGQSGTYALTVSPAFARAAAGIYTIRIADRRAATDDDRSQQTVRALRAAYLPMLERYRSDAQPLVERALAAVQRRFAPDDIHVALIRRDLARALRQAHQYEQAQQLYEGAAAVFERTLGADHPSTAEVWMSLAAMYGQLGQRPKAEALARRALDVSEKALGPNHPQVALGLITLANRLNAAEDRDTSEELERR